MAVRLQRSLLFLYSPLSIFRTNRQLDYTIGCLIMASVDVNKYCTSYIHGIWVMLKKKKTEKHYSQFLSMFSVLIVWRVDNW